MNEEEYSMAKKGEISLGEQVYELINGNAPAMIKQALREAEERCLKDFSRDIEEREIQLKDVHERLEEFKSA